MQGGGVTVSWGLTQFWTMAFRPTHSIWQKKVEWNEEELKKVREKFNFYLKKEF